MGKGFDMWCFIVTPDDFTVFELTPEYVRMSGPYPASTFKEALDGVLDVVRRVVFYRYCFEVVVFYESRNRVKSISEQEF